MDKRATVLLLLALILVALPLSGQQNVDLIVLLDSSKSMFMYFNDVVDYVLTGTMREYLRFGDTFHLINFADTTTVEMNQPLRTEQDLKSVIARLYLQYPLGLNTDLVTALRNVYGYVSGLPAASKKYIILISDGMHSPAPGTPYADMDANGISREINDAASRIKDSGWVLKIIRIPFDGQETTNDAGSIVTVVPNTSANATVAGGTETSPTSPGSGNYLDQVAKASGAEVTVFDPRNSEAVRNETIGLPTMHFPPDLGQQRYSFSFNAEMYNPSSVLIELKLKSIHLPDGTDILVKGSALALAPGANGTLPIRIKLPGSLEPGEKQLILEPRFVDGIRVTPARSSTKVILKRGVLTGIGITGNKLSFVLIAALVVFVLASVILIALYSKRAHRKTETPIVEAVIDSTAAISHHKDAKTLLAASTQTHHVAGNITAYSDTRSKDASQLHAGSTHAHRVALVPASLSTGTGAELKVSEETTRAQSILGSWQHTGSTRLALPAKDQQSNIGRGFQISPPHYEARIVKPGAQRILLHVRGQNPNIGRRNIHVMHAGNKKTIGGRGSDFLVFLLPFPRGIAHVYYDGIDITMVPTIADCFPDSGEVIENCMGREIKVVNKQGGELFLQFLRYIPPIENINRLLHSIDTPGLFSLDLASTFDETMHQGMVGL